MQESLSICSRDARAQSSQRQLPAAEGISLGYEECHRFSRSFPKSPRSVTIATVTNDDTSISNEIYLPASANFSINSDPAIASQTISASLVNNPEA